MRIKKQYYKMTEDCLKSVNLIEGHIEDLKKEIEEIKCNDGTTGINYEGEKVSETFKISKQVENTAIKNITREDLIRKQIELYIHKLDKINMAMLKLKKGQKEILELFYICDLDWFEVTYKQYRSLSTCKRIRTKAIQKLAFILYGKEALESFDFINKIV